MHALANFITALCWIWGGLMALSVVVHVLDYDDQSADLIGDSILFGILAWAWLIARYCF